MLISAGMITKDAGDYLEYSLKSINDYVDEIIIVDDNSKDNTLDIASSFPKVKIVRGTYNGDKKTQRNEYLKRAKGSWIMTPDADEVFYKANMEWLVDYLANKDEDKDPSLFIAIYHRTFWKDFRHVISGQVWSGSKHRIFKNIDGLKYDKFHFAVNLNKDELLHTHAQQTGKRLNRPKFMIAHYGYCRKSSEIRKKIEYYMRRDNPNCKTEKDIRKYVDMHPYFSGNFNHPRYGRGGLSCCGNHAGRVDKVSLYEGEHPEVMHEHPDYYRLNDYVINMNKYMEDHWRFHNHLTHERHVNRLKLTGKHCVGSTLDVGCANGFSTNLLQEVNSQCKFSGSEPTDWGHSHAVESYLNITFYKDYGENLSVRDKSFDTVLLSEVIEHVDSPKILLKEALRVAKKRLVVTTPTQMHPDPDHKRFYTVDQMIKILSKHGEVGFTGLKRNGDFTNVKENIYFMIAWCDIRGSNELT